MSQNFHTSYVETLGKLETQYCKLKVSFFDQLSHVLFMENLVPSKQLFSLIQRALGLALFWFSVY